MLLCWFQSPSVHLFSVTREAGITHVSCQHFGWTLASFCPVGFLCTLTAFLFLQTVYEKHCGHPDSKMHFYNVPSPRKINYLLYTLSHSTEEMMMIYCRCSNGRSRNCHHWSRKGFIPFYPDVFPCLFGWIRYW